MDNNLDKHFLESELIIKQEPEILESMNINSSASVPIPTRRTGDMFGTRHFGSQLEVQSPCLDTDTSDTFNILSGNTLWSTRLIGLDGEVSKNDAFVYMEDDDIFQVDKADLIQGPTLAELNANDENLLEDLNFDDLLLPEEKFTYANISDVSNQKLFNHTIPINNNNLNTMSSTPGSCPPLGIGFYKDSFERSSVSSSPFDTLTTRAYAPAFSPTSQTSSSSSLIQSASSPSCLPVKSEQAQSTLHELLLKWDSSPDKSVLGHSVPDEYSSSPLKTAHVKAMQGQTLGLSSSAPTHLGLEHIWQRREPRKHLLSTGSMAEAGSTSSLSTAGILSPEGHDFSNDEVESDEDSDHYEDYSSDGDSDIESDRNFKHASKKERYFWQYNVQAKGPKGQRLIMKAKMEDPHVLNEVTDPVFSPSCSVRGIKHSGKARKGDGNDLTPNPRKLHNIGRELDKLGRIINDMTPVSELPFNVRPKSRKEKNKLASRACRLKKKAQHEANKIKLHGLESEHKRLINAISQGKQVLVAKLNETAAENQQELTNHLEKLLKSSTKVKIAGFTTDYVNKVIEKVKGGPTSLGFFEDL